MHRQKNIMTIDVEAWFSDLEFQYWNTIKDRMIENVENLLKILEKKNAKATFFLVGYFAKKYPELVEKIRKENHEISSHGYSHKSILNQTPTQFKDDLIKSKKILEKIIGEKIWGYRAPFFTITEKTSWAIKILKKVGFLYDSSIFPFKIYKYGVPDAPIFPYYISMKNIKLKALKDGFLEFPLSVYRIPIIKKNIPIAGGFYLRSFPYQFISYAIKKINKKNHPAVMYTHPWEFDPNHPRLNSIVWYNYYRLDKTEKKFRHLLNDFKFTSIQNWIENEM